MWRSSSLSFLKNDKPLVMAHRGNSSNVPENTLEAFRDAYELDCVDCLETDVHLTKDEKFVFFHDPKVNRTTDGKKKKKNYTLNQLKELDAGYAFEDEEGKYPYRGKGLKVQSVEDVVLEFPEVRFNMDIKSKNEKAPRLLAKLLEDLGMEYRVMVGSFWPKQVKRFRQYSTIPTSASIWETWRFRKKAFKLIKQKRDLTKIAEDLTQESVFGNDLPYFALQIPEKLFFLRIIKGPAFLAFAHAMNIAVHVWTINEKEDMQRLLKWGVDGLFTDKPALLIEIIDEMGYMN